MILGILQARASSTRLPGKVLRPVLGKPMLELQIERLLRAQRLDLLVLATSIDSSDDPIEALGARLGIECSRGSLDDVLDRFQQAAQRHAPEYVVRLTGDCPLADPELIDRVVDFCLAGGFDYASNTLEPTFPDGLDAEVMRASALAAAACEARLPSQREHVTPFIYAHPQRFRLGSYRSTDDRSHMRWTVDDIDDLEFVDGIYRALYPENPAFTTDDVVSYLAAHPEIASLNSRHRRNEGYVRSLSRDPSGAQTKEIPP